MTHKSSLSVTIKKINKSVVPEAILIAEQQLGEGFTYECDLLSANIISFCAIREDRVVGLCCGQVLSAKKLTANHLEISRSIPSSLLKTNRRIGLVNTIAVDNDAKGCGVGTQLLQALLSQFDAKNIRLSVLSGWKDKNGLHIGGIARAAGFEEICEIPDFYEEDSIFEGFTCPVCGPPPCKCGAVIMVRVKKAVRVMLESQSESILST